MTATRSRIGARLALAIALATLGAHCANDDEAPSNRPALTTARECPVRQAGALTSSEDASQLLDSLIRDPSDLEALDRWKKLLPRYGDLFVVEGDLLIREPDLENYILNTSSHLRGTGDEAPVRTSELFLNRPDGRKGCWEADERPLTYTIDRASFCGDESDCPAYQAIRADVAMAIADWEASCPECNVEFELESDVPPKPAESSLLFVVRQCEMYPTLGLAFFPGDEIGRHYLDVAPESAFSRHGRVGVLRHELGHVLGYRHEQLDRSSGCFRAESGNWERLTEYDPRSVMHYPCGQAVGENERLKISALDREGHRRTYTEVCGP